MKRMRKTTFLRHVNYEIAFFPPRNVIHNRLLPRTLWGRIAYLFLKYEITHRQNFRKRQKFRRIYRTQNTPRRGLLEICHFSCEFFVK